jgi:ABC-type transport system involved in cytochrome c biogenesis permease subunit
MPTPGQLALLILAITLFAVGGITSLLRVKDERAGLRLIAKQCLYWGLLAAGAVLVWHSIHRGSWLPLEDNFDALVWLGFLLAAFVLYVQGRRPVGGIDWFLMPIVILLLIAAAVFGQAKPHLYTQRTWSWVHRVTAYGGAVAFAVAGAVGAMYLINNRRLRNKAVLSAGGPKFASLERLEHFTRVSVTLGFALLTVGLITGLFEVLRNNGGALGAHWFLQPKVLLAFGVWVVYALVLHAPINPSFRGRRAAMLSIVGFVLMIGVLIAVQFMPQAAGGRR